MERQGDLLFQRGLAQGNQAHLGTGLQVFYNLGTLPSVVETMLGDMQTKLKETWTEGLDIKRISSGPETGTGTSEAKTKGIPGKASLPQANMAAYRATLWTNIDSALDGLHAHIVKVYQLQRLLCKKVDPLSHQAYICCLQDPSLVNKTWATLTKVIQECLATAVSRSNFVKQTVEAEYPKLVKLYSETWSKLRSSRAQYGPQPGDANQPIPTLSDPFGSQEMDEGLRAALATLEQAYLARSLSRLFDPVNLMFSGSGVPSNDEVTNVFPVMWHELSIALVEPRLLDAVTKNVCKTVSLFCVKSEGFVDSEASQVIGAPTPAQLQNVGMVNRLATFHSGLQGLCDQQGQALAQQRVDMLLAAGQDLVHQMEAATAPLLGSVGDSVEAILLTLHKENFSGELQDTVAGPAPACSLYMKELQAFMERIARDFLSTFSCPSFLARQLQPLAEKTISVFVTQACLVRPLGGGGAMRLASDCAQLEFALSSILGPSGQSSIGPTGLIALGQGYRLLRAFRALLFLSPHDVAVYPGLGSSLPYSTALHLVMSRCPPSLPSPHSSLGWSLARYSAWLEDHRGERERLLLVQGALEAYVAAAKARQDKAFVTEYPLLMEMLAAGLKQLH